MLYRQKPDVRVNWQFNTHIFFLTVEMRWLRASQVPNVLVMLQFRKLRFALRQGRDLDRQPL